jgi:hypothetical protein
MAPTLQGVAESQEGLSMPTRDRFSRRDRRPDAQGTAPLSDADRRGIEAIERELAAEYAATAPDESSRRVSVAAHRARSPSPVAVAFALGCLVGASAGAVLTALVLLARAYS